MASRRAWIALLTASTVVGAASSCLDFGALTGGIGDSSDGGGDGGSSDALLGDAAIADGGVDARPEPSIKLAASNGVTCALNAGVLKCWGNNGGGRLGLGEADSDPHSTPTAVTLPFTPTMFSMSDNHTCASDGTNISCWGDGDNSVLGQSPDMIPSCSNSCPTCSYTCPTPVAITGLGTIASLALGQYATCFLPTTGGVSCFGNNNSGQIGPLSIGEVITVPEDTSITNVASFGAGSFYGCALTTNGSVWCMGANDLGELGQKTSGDAGVDNNPHGTPMQVPGIVNARQISVGDYSACATLTDNTVTCWGTNSFTVNEGSGQLGHDPKSDPTCNMYYPCDPIPTPVAGLTNVREVSVGGNATCAVRLDDSVVCWGSNVNGLLDNATNVGPDSTYPYNFTPQVMPDLTSKKQIAHVTVGGAHACVVTWDDHVMCWGDNSYGELGVSIDAGISSPTPVVVEGI